VFSLLVPPSGDDDQNEARAEWIDDLNASQDPEQDALKLALQRAATLGELAP
jgi:hypothetical protein